MSELVIRIGTDERIRIEEMENGITHVKDIRLELYTKECRLEHIQRTAAGGLHCIQ